MNNYCASNTQSSLDIKIPKPFVIGKTRGSTLWMTSWQCTKVMWEGRASHLSTLTWRVAFNCWASCLPFWVEYWDQRPAPSYPFYSAESPCVCVCRLGRHSSSWAISPALKVIIELGLKCIPGWTWTFSLPVSLLLRLQAGTTMPDISEAGASCTLGKLPLKLCWTAYSHTTLGDWFTPYKLHNIASDTIAHKNILGSFPTGGIICHSRFI